MDPVKAEKETAMRRYRQIQKVARLLRCIEACIALLLLSWSTTRLPTAAKISGDFLRRFAAVLLSPRFVFLLGNAIVLVLFAKSSSSSSSSSSSATPSSSSSGDLYDEFIEGRQRIGYSSQPPAKEDVVYEDKTVCLEVRAECRRSQSENLERRMKAPELRRTESDCSGEKQAEEGKGEMSNEEFRRTIEAFIAEQMSRFHREEESMAIVSSAGTPEANKIKYQKYA